MGASERTGQARRRRWTARWALATALLAALAASATAAGLGPSTRVTVKPGSGTARTHFSFSFRVPVATGTFGSEVRTDTFSASGPRAADCQSGMARTLKPAKRGARVKLTLRPAEGGGGWCPGRWHGALVQAEMLRCNPSPARACPQLVLAPQTIATFRFRVRARTTSPPPPAPSGDVPKFAGLISATTCPSPLPQGPDLLPRPSNYQLTWDPATDPVTPSSQSVYDIFVATAPGGEDYAKPSWTTSPGATSFLTPSVPREGTVYFVVRARNAAGREDGNTLERQGLVQCAPVSSQPQPARR